MERVAHLPLALVALAGFLAAGCHGSPESARDELSAALSKANGAFATDAKADSPTSIKLTYAVEATNTDGATERGDMLIVIENGRYVFGWDASADGARTRFWELSERGESTSCFSFASPDPGSISDLWGDPECETEEASDPEEDAEFLQAFGGGLDLAALQKLLEDDDVTVERDSDTTVLGLKGECYRLTTATTFGTVCIATGPGIILSTSETEDGYTSSLTLTSYSTSVTDKDFARPEWAPAAPPPGSTPSPTPSPTPRATSTPRPATTPTPRVSQEWTNLMTDARRDATDGPCAEASSTQLGDVAVAPDGSVFFRDVLGIRRWTPDCRLTTIVPAKPESGLVRLPAPITTDKAGNLYEGLRTNSGLVGGQILKWSVGASEPVAVAGAICPRTEKKATGCPPGTARLEVADGTDLQSNLSWVQGIAVVDGTIYYAEQDLTVTPWAERVYRWNSDFTSTVVATLPHGSGGVLDLLAMASGDLLVQTDGGVYKVAPTGEMALLSPGKPTCMAVDSADSVWMIIGSVAFIYSGTAKTTKSFDLPSGLTCADMAFLPDGGLFVAARNKSNAVSFWKVSLKTGN